MANERRLIEADKTQAVIVNISGHLAEAGNPEMAAAVAYAAEVIGNQPTVEAIIPVRCKDCKHWQKHHGDYRTDGICDCLVKYHDAGRYMTEGDHYCSYGERRCENG